MISTIFQQKTRLINSEKIREIMNLSHAPNLYSKIC